MHIACFNINELNNRGRMEIAHGLVEVGVVNSYHKYEQSLSKTQNTLIGKIQNS